MRDLLFWSLLPVWAVVGALWCLMWVLGAVMLIIIEAALRLGDPYRQLGPWGMAMPR